MIKLNFNDAYVLRDDKSNYKAVYRLANPMYINSMRLYRRII